MKDVSMLTHTQWLLKEELPSFFGQNEDPTTLIIVGVLALVIVLMVVFGIRRSVSTQWNRTKAVFSTDEVFDRLCEANHLTNDEIFMVKRMIFDLRLDNPLLAFIIPDLSKDYDKGETPRNQRVIRSLRAKLFASIDKAELPTADEEAAAEANAAGVA